MREFIYLSPEKLERFFNLSFQFPIVDTIEAKGAGLSGKISFSHEERNAPKAELIRQIKRVEKELKKKSAQYTDEHLMPGQWVSFERKLGYSLVSSGESRILLMTQVSDEMVLGDVALLLHGNPKNFLLTVRRVIDPWKDLDSYPRRLVDLANELREAEVTDVLPENLGEADRAGVELFTRVARIHDGTCMVRGFAKVSNVIEGQDIFLLSKGFDPKRLVVASPLYVESIA